MNRLFLIIAIILIAMTGCSQSTIAENPQWIDRLIHKFQSEPVGNPPQSIWRYEYQGQTVYFVPQQCCDQFSALYDVKGDDICAPDGGLTGRGDGNCADFFTDRSDEILVWKDTRTR
ncbi:MAG: hypothetical protein WBV22_01890 [Anaerolineaceae bacterium]